MKKESMLDIFELASEDFPQSDFSGAKGGTHRVKSKGEKLGGVRAASDRNVLIANSQRDILRSVLSESMKHHLITPQNAQLIIKQVDQTTFLGDNKLLAICYKKLSYVLETIAR